MWNDRRERKLPSAVLRRRPAGTNSPAPDGNTDPSDRGARARAKPPPPPPPASGPRPTFTGAQDWVQRHRADIDTVVKLLERYPNLIQSEGLDPLWDFLRPVLLDKRAAAAPGRDTENRREEGRTRRKNRGAKNHRATHHRSRSDRPRSDSAGTTRYVYVCDAPSSSSSSSSSSGESPPPDKSTRDRVVAALSGYCYVRTSPELPGSRTDLAEVLRAVSTADAFLFLLRGASLASWFCLHQLGIALTYDVPVVAVREAGYHLPEALPSEFDRLEIVRPASDVVPSRQKQGHARSKSSDTWQERRGKSESQSSGFHSDSENVLRGQQPPEESVCTLSDAVRNCFQTSVLYVPNFHDSCIAKLLGRLSDYLGDTFLDAEVSKTEKLQRTGDSQSTDSENSDRFPDIKGSAVFRKLPLKQGARDKSAERTPSSDGSHDPPDTPTSTDKSSIATTSPPIKLPPITSVHCDETPTRREEPPAGPENTAKLTAHFTGLFVSPPSSPFLRTRYLVFPGGPKGSSKEPYLVAFPSDICGDDAHRVEVASESPPVAEKDEHEEVEIRLLQMDDDPSFDKIKLDVRQDAICEKSPFSTPLPGTRKPNGTGRSSKTPGKEAGRRTRDLPPLERAPKAAERCDRFRTQNGRLRGLQIAERNKQAEITAPTKKYLRNSSSEWLTTTGPFDKKNFKMTKVSLQYGPDGKLPNPLI